MLAYGPLRDIVEQEIIELRASRNRRASEKTVRRKQDLVASFYNQLRPSNSGELLPSLSTFRQIPAIHSLEKFEGTADELAVELKNKHSLTRKVLQDILERWRQDVRKDLATKLRIKPAKDKSGTLAPAERLNARFVCMRCEKVSKSFKEDGCLVRSSRKIRRAIPHR
jgi:hypothetical protein